MAAPSAPADHERASLLQNVQLDNFIVRVQEKLLPPAVEVDVMRRAALVLRPQDYEEVVAERQNARLCGFPGCGQALEASTAQFRVSISQRKVFKAQSPFCSERCYGLSANFLSSLSPDPVYLRQLRPGPAPVAAKKPRSSAVAVVPAQHKHKHRHEEVVVTGGPAGARVADDDAEDAGDDAEGPSHAGRMDDDDDDDDNDGGAGAKAYSDLIWKPERPGKTEAGDSGGGEVVAEAVPRVEAVPPPPPIDERVQALSQASPKRLVTKPAEPDLLPADRRPVAPEDSQELSPDAIQHLIRLSLAVRSQEAREQSQPPAGGPSGPSPLPVPSSRPPPTSDRSGSSPSRPKQKRKTRPQPQQQQQPQQPQPQAAPAEEKQAAEPQAEPRQPEPQAPPHPQQPEQPQSSPAKPKKSVLDLQLGVSEDSPIPVHLSLSGLGSRSKKHVKQDVGAAEQRLSQRSQLMSTVMHWCNDQTRRWVLTGGASQDVWSSGDPAADQRRLALFQCVAPVLTELQVQLRVEYPSMQSDVGALLRTLTLNRPLPAFTTESWRFMGLCFITMVALKEQNRLRRRLREQEPGWWWGRPTEQDMATWHRLLQVWSYTPAEFNSLLEVSLNIGITVAPVQQPQQPQQPQQQPAPANNNSTPPAVE